MSRNPLGSLLASVVLWFTITKNTFNLTTVYGAKSLNLLMQVNKAECNEISYPLQSYLTVLNALDLYTNVRICRAKGCVLFYKLGNRKNKLI